MFGSRKKPKPAYRIILQVEGHVLQRRVRDLFGDDCWVFVSDHNSLPAAENALTDIVLRKRRERQTEALNDGTGVLYDYQGRHLT